MSENKSKFPSRPKILAASLAGILIALPAYAADNPPAEVTESSNIEALTVTGKRSADQKGADDVYYKNVSNAYVGKEYLERYRVQSAGDVLKGLNGVYNMNTRTAGGAITPNIRGITGKGRIPVTLDGTEQTVDVWLNNYGVGDRNYLDPALFRSIAVEKSPALTRGVKSGVGGAMSIRTIEPADIIPEGKNWGIEVKTEFSGNTVAQKNDLRQFLGRDYRTLSPIGATADGTGGSSDANSILSGKPSPTSLRLDPGIADTKYAGGKSHTNFKDDRQLMLSAAFKTDITDGLAAYSHRQKGNYYAGKRGWQQYINNPVYGAQSCYERNDGKPQGEKDLLCKPAESLIPNMAMLFRPGEEIMNSHTDTKTLLLKNNWYLPGNQKISLQYMDNKIGFGEINPLITAWILGWRELSSDKTPVQQSPGISTKIDSKTYKLGYEWKPQNNKWIDFQADMWRVKTNSDRYQSGGPALGVTVPDFDYDIWYWCRIRGKKSPRMFDYDTCETEMQENRYGSARNHAEVLPMLDNNPRQIAQKLAEHEARYREIAERWIGHSGGYYRINPGDDKIYTDVRNHLTGDNATLAQLKRQLNQERYGIEHPDYTIVHGNQQRTAIVRNGFNLSNRFRLSDKLSLTLAADYQRETLEERTQTADSDDIMNLYGILTRMAGLAGPQSAKKREWGANLVFDWKPTSRLNIQAGVRYQNFKGRNIELARQRAARNPWYQYGLGSDSYVTGLMMPYYELADEEDIANQKRMLQLYDPNRVGEQVAEYQDLNRRFKEKNGYDFNPHDTLVGQDTRFYAKSDGNFVQYADGNKNTDVLYVLRRKQIIPMNAGKFDPGKVHITPEMYRERVNNPQGKSGSYRRYIPGSHITITPGSVSETTDRMANENQISSETSNDQVLESDSNYNRTAWIRHQFGEADRWRIPQEQRAHSWAPMLSVSYDLADNHRLFARYARMSRFPSLYELTAATGGGGLYGSQTVAEYSLKPEKSTNWEVGYNFNFAPHFAKLRQGDLRLTYYSNKIKNQIDTSNMDGGMIQYDKAVSKGVELQSRLDSGRFFASFGGTYRLKHMVCDRGIAFKFDYYLQRVPECLEGGFGLSRFFQSLQPKYSLTLDVGTRFFNEKLELGMRAIHHSKAERKNYTRMMALGVGDVYDSSGKPYSWHAATLLDAYARYRIGKHIDLNFGVTNLANRYYLDPMSSTPVPGPGRTVTFGIKGRF
ncbi:TonB-dependent receptor [Neisseria elongata subsp. glycolytica ATCC 29315]|uniref:TonB-dependent receptor n=2 Tax=Neisseria elongata subsp. glycolytica ATCC 29315 TaxID=546263 RepID=A0A0B5CMQ8_NEIEG|nr:TonB-dependent receptor [Neisseria elongata]AJE18669.1 TonB-dependent receptor [Neisseria elongata subsp. glycolytica ATCC 29315]SQH50557.1 TonB-dependent receptor [Neisseria elongata subsp. glycolytica]